MTEPLRILCVCTHNRTRSVMTGALLGRHLERLGVRAEITTAGTSSDGQPAMERAVRLLADRGIDADAHRSRRLDDEVIDRIDLIVTAERDHVVFVAGRWPARFRSTFTLPELVERSESVGPVAGGDLATWLAVVNADRPDPLDYLDADDIPEVADPTGASPAVWDASFAEIDELTRRLAERLA